MPETHGEMIDRLHAANVALAVEHGPRSTARYAIYVVGRDRARERALLGGLGELGVGRMWVSAQMAATREGFAAAPEIDEASEEAMSRVNVEADRLILIRWRARARAAARSTPPIATGEGEPK